MQSPLEQFIVKPVVSLPPVAGYDFTFSSASLWMLIGVGLTSLLMVAGIRKKEMVPGRLQNLPEMLYEFILGMVNDTLHEKEGRKYFPFIFTLFMIVLMGNVLGLLPNAFTYTSHIIVTAAMALFVFFMATLIGIFRHGLHFFSLFLPKGLPWVMVPLVIPIEIISYLSRPVSLSVRLCANMMVGHTMLKLFAAFTGALLAAAVAKGSMVGGAGLGLVGVVPFVFNLGLLGLELLIAFIQAYIFAILSCIYLKDCIELH